MAKRAGQPERRYGRPRHRRLLVWVAGVVGTLALVLGLLAIPLACTTVIIPPVVKGEAAEILLVDYGRTPALVLPAQDGGYDRWVYGDWNYYALDNTGPHRGMMALFLPTQGALGREHFAPPATLESVRLDLSRTAENVYTIRVPADEAAQLQQELSSLFEANRQTLTPRPNSPLNFVYHPDTYSYFHNSNHQTAGWLRELGAATHGPSFYSSWEIRQPATEE